MRAALLAFSAALLTAVAIHPVHARVTKAGLVEDHSAALATLLQRSDEDYLKRNPLSALARGDLRYAHRLGNDYSDEYFAAEKEAAERDLKALASIDRDRLSPAERVSYDTFEWRCKMDLAGVQPPILAFRSVLPIDHFNGFHLAVANLSSGEGIAPYRTASDHENGLRRLDEFAELIDLAIARLRQGKMAGITQPRIVMDRVLAQLNDMLGKELEESSFFRPATSFPDYISTADRDRLRAGYRDIVLRKVNPALARLRDFIEQEYIPAARQSIGLRDVPGGLEYYNYLVSSYTTTNLSPDEIHDIGLDNVALIRSEMEKVKQAVGFTGSLKEFFDHIRTDPKFKPASREALQQGYVEIGRRVDQTIAKLFKRQPRTPLEIRPVPPLEEAGAARGYYQPGNPDGSRPGVFYYNAYDLPSRTTPSMETLYLHEGAPGHHFEISLAQENGSLPKLQRFRGLSAFSEGWGLYSESLGRELGLYTDPYQYFGYLDSQMFRAIRLVVDTGIHSKGWTREQTIQYILDNSSRGLTNATAETDRYIANPGQSLSYKIGQLKIGELRARAEKRLGDRFDVREFHEKLLEDGGIPLTVLERKIDEWIAGKGG